jgi:pyrroline-5-carboxylate reductase
MSEPKKLGLLGFGVMASAMVQCALSSGFFAPEDLIVFDKSPAAIEKAKALGIAVAQSAGQVIEQASAVQLGTKPQDLESLLLQIADSVGQYHPLLISIAAGVPLQKIYLGTHVVRLMPNLNATIGQSMTAYCAGAEVSAEELDFVAQYCTCFGKAIPLEEKHFSAFCALASSAPAFVFLFLDELARAGVTCGLPKALALEIATQMTLGSAMQTAQSDQHPYALIDRVCSPAGTTIAGINKLRELGFAHAVSQAVQASYQRDIQLGK